MGDWAACPHCGERIRSDAKSCRHCGSDDSTGWSQATYLDGVDLPEPGDYEDNLEREGFRAPARSSGRLARPSGQGPLGNRWAAAAVSLVLLLVFAAWLLRGLF
jgi:hypothetical protein